MPKPPRSFARKMESRKVVHMALRGIGSYEIQYRIQ
jgi:hypothetical protein